MQAVCLIKERMNLLNKFLAGLNLGKLQKIVQRIAAQERNFITRDKCAEMNIKFQQRHP